MRNAVNQEAVSIAGAALPEMPGVPLHERVKRWLSEAILMGQWPPGTRVPGEEHLAATLGVAVGTVRRALADLVAEGLIHRRPKIGTVVTGRSPHHSLRFFYQYFRLHGLDGELLRSKPQILSYAVEAASAAERTALDLAEEAKVVRIGRLRRVEGRPVMHETLAIDAARLPDFPAGDALPELLYFFLLDRYGIRITSVRESLSAALADDRDCALLEIAPPTPILVIDEVSYDQAGRPTIVATHRAITDRYRYTHEVR